MSIVRQNPCRYCCAAYEDKITGRHMPSFINPSCAKCEYRKSHKKYLMSVRKYRPGKQIASLEDLLKCTFVIWHGKTVHVEVIKSWQLRVVNRVIHNGSLYEAVENCRETEKGN